MVKVFIIFSFLSSFFNQLYCQNSALDKIFETKLKSEVLKYNIDLLNKSNSFFLKKNFDSTLVYTSKYLYSSNKEVTEVNKLIFFLRGICFKEKRMFNEAKQNFLMIKNSFVFESSVNNNLGQIYLELEKFNEAEKYLKSIEDIEDYNYNNINKGKLLINLGLCYFFQNEFTKAENYLIKGSKIHVKNKDTLSVIGSYINLGNLYYEQFKDELAIPYFQKAYDLSKSSKFVKEKFSSALNMSVIEENRKNFEKAISFRKEADIWKDSLNDQNKIWKIAQLEKKFAISQKEKEIELLEVKNEIRRTQRNGLLIIASILIITLFISLYFYSLKVKRNKIIQAQKEDLDVLNETKDKLFSIVSHDLRSSVNALKSSNSKLLHHLETKNYHELDGLLHKNSAIANGSYNLLDNLLNWASQQTNQLYFCKESLHLKTIINQVEYNFKPLVVYKNIALKIDIDNSFFVWMDLDSFKIILRNLLDNALKFTDEGGYISIYSLEKHNNFIELVIEDSGKGIEKNKISDLLSINNKVLKKTNKDTIGSGLGFQLCLSMIYKNEGKINIVSEIGKGTKVILILPKYNKNG